jgi:hypothetical protein
VRSCERHSDQVQLHCEQLADVVPGKTAHALGQATSTDALVGYTRGLVQVAGQQSRLMMPP